MAEVSDILLAALKTWNADAAQPRRDVSLVVEFYDHDELPPFDPANAIECFAAGKTADGDGDSEPITFMGVEYRRELLKVGEIDRGWSKEANTSNPTFSNLDDYVASFALNFPGGLEGCHFVVRLLSRSQSVDLDDTLVLYTGRCDRHIKGNRKEFFISTKQHLISIESEVPPRRLGPDDPEGRAVGDPLNEGFRFIPQNFTGPAFKETVRRSGILGAIGLTKTVTRTLPVTSHSGLNPAGVLPIVGGRAKMPMLEVAYLDVGGAINFVGAFVDGVSYGIEDIRDVKNDSGSFGPVQNVQERYGYVANEGPATRQQIVFSGTPIPGNGFYSRTAVISAFVGGGSIETEEQAPAISATILGSHVPLPDSTGSYLAKTGSINSGTPTVIVSDSGYRNGDLLIIEGAAASSRRMYATVSSGGGTTTLTLSANAGTTVAGATVRKVGFTDNPVHLARWIITDPNLLNFPEEWMDDVENYASSLYCDQYLVDEADTDRVALPDSENPATNGGVGAGVDYRRLTSTSHVSPLWFRRVQLGDLTADPYDQEADYTYFDPAAAAPTFTPSLTYRRRYTANFGIVEALRAVDFLFDVLFPCFRGYLTQGSNSKVAIKIKKPADHSYVTANITAGATSVPIESVMGWIDSLRGVIGIGAQEATCEVRTVTSLTYSLAGNGITLAVTGALTASGATFSGGDGASTPATATVTVTGTGALTVTIDGEAVSYTTTGDDTTSTAAAMLQAAIAANPVLNPYVKAVWNLSTGVSLTAKMGSLHFAAPLEFDHDAGEEVLRGAASFSGGASVQADALRSNMLKGSFGFSGTGSSGKGEYNQVRLKFRDASQDYRLTEVRIPKPSEITGTIRPKEFNGNAIDNYHQAYRIAAGLHAELVDSNIYTQHASDGEALLVDEGEVIFSTHDAGGFVNLPVLVERVRISDDLKATFECKRYLTAMFTDDVVQRQVPLPTTLTWQRSGPSTPTGLTLTEIAVTATSSTVRAEFDFVAFAAPQVGIVYLKRDGEPDFVKVGRVAPVDDGLGNLSGTFDMPGLEPGTHEFKVSAEGYGRESVLSAMEDITTTTSGSIVVTTFEGDTITVNTELEFDNDAARDLSRANLGAADEEMFFLGF